MSDTFTPADLGAAVTRMASAGVRGAPRASMVLTLYPAWQNGPLGEYSGEELMRGVDLWLAAQPDPSRATFPQPGQLVKAITDDRAKTRRKVEAAHGGQVPDDQRKRLGVFTGWRERCVGREWTTQEQVRDGRAADGGLLVVWQTRTYRDFRTFCGNGPIPEQWRADGWTVEIPVERGRTADGAGMAWCRGMEYRPFAPGGAQYVDRRAAPGRRSA